MTERIPFPEHAWPLLRKALEHIAAHPDEFYMGAFLVTRELLGDVAWGESEEAITQATGHPFPACGTVACLAGRIILESGEAPPDVRDRDYLWASRACDLLGVSDDDGARSALWGVFYKTHIATYAELVRALEHRFTFPEPLPAIPVAASS